MWGCGCAWIQAPAPAPASMTIVPWVFSVHCITEAILSLRNVGNEMTDNQTPAGNGRIITWRISIDLHSSQTVPFESTLRKYFVVKCIYGAPPCRVPAARQGQRPAQCGSRYRRSTGRGGMDVCRRNMMAGYFEPVELSTTPSGAGCRVGYGCLMSVASVTSSLHRNDNLSTLTAFSR